MCHLRGLVQLHMNAADRAKECFIEALSIDVKCYESFEALVNGNMLDVQEGERSHPQVWICERHTTLRAPPSSQSGIWCRVWHSGSTRPRMPSSSG